MGFAWIFVLFIVVGGGIAYLSYSLKKKRQQGLAFAAKQLGMQFALDDPFDTLVEPFDLLSKGDGRGVENVMWGTWQDIECRLFDYWYYEESTDSKGNRSRTYYRFSDIDIDRCDATSRPVGRVHQAGLRGVLEQSARRARRR